MVYSILLDDTIEGPSKLGRKFITHKFLCCHRNFFMLENFWLICFTIYIDTHISFHPFNHHNYIYVILFKVLLILRSTCGFQIIICSISFLKFVFATKRHSAMNLLNHTVSKHHYVMHLNCTVLKTNNFTCVCVLRIFLT